MKLAADFRREAREALRGKWPMAILIGLVDRAEPGFEVLFAYLPKWKTTALTRLWKSMYILVGTLLLVVQGIIMG